MNILIVGETNTGKSNLGDIVGNTIFRMDSEATVYNHDPDRSLKTIGNGRREYHIYVKSIDKGESIDSGEFKNYDTVVYITNPNFKKLLKSIKE